ncbi:MAG: hypothetical protein JWO31_370 [Phycisphaerales bacterium]|nr:hypothetical protein [Phycisphaerales bacterium]
MTASDKPIVPPASTTTPNVALAASPVPTAALASDDPVLTAVIDAVEHNPDFHLAVTLYVGGVLVSGEMVSDREYLAGVGRAFAAAGENRPAAYATQLGHAMAAAAGRASTQVRTHRFVNLKNVRVLSPGSALMPSNGYWRGSAAAVNGYSWGLLT